MENRPMTNPTQPDTTIETGDRVRSYDSFYWQDEDRGKSYVEGTVVGITDPSKHFRFRDCPRYRIRVERDVFDGEERTGFHARTGSYVFPPVNGAEMLLGGTTNQVVRL